MKMFPPTIASWLAARGLVLTRCITTNAVQRSMAPPVLVVIAADFAIAAAMAKTGAAAWIANDLVLLAENSSLWFGLALVYLTTRVLSKSLHPDASAAILFPICIAAAKPIGVDPRSFAMAIAAAVGCAFASPVTYPTHLIVDGSVDYRFSDFARTGLLLHLICAAIVLTLAPLIWPLLRLMQSTRNQIAFVNTKMRCIPLLLVALLAMLWQISCASSNEPSQANPPPFSTQLLGQTDYPTPRKMAYRTPRILLEAEGVRVVFDLINGKPYPHFGVILKITLLGSSGERQSQEVYVGPMLSLETKRVSTLVENIDFNPTDLTVELLAEH